MKLKFVLVVLLSLFFSVSLLSALEPVDFPSLGPCGVMRMVTDDELLWDDEEPEEEESSFLSGSLFGSDEEVDPTMGVLLEQAEDIFWRVVGANTIMPLADKYTVLASSSYTNGEEDLGFLNGSFVSPPGYRLIRSNKPEVGKAIALENELGGLIFIKFLIRKNMNTGVGKSGKMGGYVRMEVSICDASGKTVFIKSYSATTATKKTIKVSFGGFDQAELMKLYPELFEEVCQKFVADMK